MGDSGKRAPRFFFWMLLWMGLVLGAHCGAEPMQSPGEGRAPLKFKPAFEGLPVRGMWKSTPASADINKDGFADLAAIPRLGDGAHVWLGNGSGKWTDASQGLKMDNSCGGGVAFGDINKDGHLDLAVADHCHGVSIYLGDGQGHWSAVVQKLNPAIVTSKAAAENEDVPSMFMGSEDLAMGDVNEDGFLDLVVASSDQGGLTVYFGDGSGKSWVEAKSDGLPSGEDPEPGDEENAGWANQVLLADVDGDGHLDVVAAYYTGPRVWRGDGKGHWQNRSQGLTQSMTGGLYRGMAVGDVNEDGRIDLVAANDVNGPELYLQQPDGTWQATPDIFPALEGGAVSIALGDLDGDKHLDLVVAGRRTKDLGASYGLFVLLGDGKGKWKEAPGTDLPGEGLSVTWGVTLTDLNHDGMLDLAVGSGGEGAGGEKPLGPPARAKAAAAKVRVIPELSLPRMQVWLNAHSK